MTSIRQLHQQLVNKEKTAVEIATEFLARIEALEPQVKSFLHLTPDLALAQARKVDEKIARGESLHPLAGIPIAIKDNLCTKGIPTTCASRILENFVPPYESTVTQKLRDLGAVIVGKTNLDEFAMGSSTENSGYHVTANPWDLSRVPGGSSGGSAAAVAAQECVVALGSDTGGSIRQPASFCGVVGLKPTYGLVSRFGLVAYASSLDQIGPFGRTVEDAAILLQAIAGYDPQDSTSLNLPIPDYSQFLKTSLKGLKIGVIKETFGEGLDQVVAEAVNQALAQLKALGATIKEISCPRFRYGLPTYYIIAPSEASANLARYDGVKYGIREDADSLIDMYTKTRDFDRAFQSVDVLVSPTSPTTAFKAGEKTADPLSMYLSDLMTIPVNLAGLPGLSLPCGFDGQGLPIGLQLVGNVLREDQLFHVAHAYEQATDWHKRQPSFTN